ncbi:MAG: toxin-antitoxin system YwqK family antitoxin [Verrucomicrobia bacterium]|nr:toxin-antitoxin system YwqK family antitoxin [Verrucomicrobiota bacterium]
MDRKKRRSGFRQRPHLSRRVRARHQAGSPGGSSASHGHRGKDCAGESSRPGRTGLRLGRLGPLSPKIVGAGLVLAALVALGLGRSGETVSSADLKPKGDLFTYQGKPFTGAALAESKGRKTEVEFWEGRMHGRFRSWYANGKMESEAYFTNGKRDGVAQLWNEQGVLVQETRFRDGLAEGDAAEWYSNGNLERRAGWQNGKRNGKVETWYENGKRKGVGFFKEGERDGTFVVWWPNGKKRVESSYLGGLPHGWWVEWDEDGDKVKQSYFVKGKESDHPPKRES